MVSNENWGIENEIRAFLVSPQELNNTNLHNFQSAGKQFSTKASIIHYKFNRRRDRMATKPSQMLLCRIVVGRVLDKAGEKQPTTAPNSSLTYHSEEMGTDLFACKGPCLVYPEYIITYNDYSAPGPYNQNSLDVEESGRSASKMCIICLERPVRYLTIPCGHPCLCEKCNNPHIRAKLKGKCPECRARFQKTAIIYGRVVNDE